MIQAKSDLKISQVRLQHGTLTLVHLQHDAQRLEYLPIHSQHDAQRLEYLPIHSQHGAPTCVRHKPQPEKYFEKKIFINFSVTSNHFLFPTVILPSISNFCHVSQHGAQLRGHPRPEHFFLTLNFSCNENL